MKFLVSGGAGFIGSHLVDALLEQRNDVIVLDNFSTGRTQNLDHVAEKIQIIECDISIPGQWQDLFKNIDYVLYSHEHSDQVSGIFELRPFFWKYKKKINIYGNLKTINHLKKRFNYCFKAFYGYPAIVKDNIIKKIFSLGEYNEKIYFNTKQVTHGLIKTTAYFFENTAYISDCNDLSIVNMKIFQNLKHLVIDCLRIKKSPVHFNLDEALYVHSCLKPKKTILTNLHHDLDYDFLLQRLPKNVLPAYDGLKLNL